MYAVIRRYQFDEGDSEQVDREIREEFVPLVEKMPGFVAYYWLNTGEGSGASLSVFQDKAGAEESVRAAVNFAQQHWAGMSVSKPEILQGEVKAHA
jgi:hypothetical protein